MSEFFGSARQSRIAFKATGKIANMTLTGYYEADWLSAGTTSNNNQSNSYTLRQRQLWADAKTTSGWDFSGGTGMVAGDGNHPGLTRGTEILPSTIDPQYEAGFVWARQESFRVIKNIGKKAFLGISAENAETLNPAGQDLPSNYIFGSTGTGGGLYDNQRQLLLQLRSRLRRQGGRRAGLGPLEVFGVDRFFRDRIYPTTRQPRTTIRKRAGGIGGGFRGPLARQESSPSA